MQIHFIRHTSPNISPGICYGQADIGLADSFAEEAQIILKKLERQTNHGQYDSIFSSPAIRCLQLAEKIHELQQKNQHKQKPKGIIIDKKIQEVNFGDWELQAWDDIPRQESQAWTDDFINVAPPNGENLLTMQDRVHSFIEQLSVQKADIGSSIVVITHAGVIRLIAAYFLKIPLSDIFNLRVNYGQVVEINYAEDSHSLRFVD